MYGPPKNFKLLDYKPILFQEQRIYTDSLFTLKGLSYKSL